MGKITSRNAYLSASFYNTTETTAASLDLSGDLNTITISQTREAPEVTVFGQTNRGRLTDGIETWEVSFDGYYTGGSLTADTAAIDQALFDMVSASNMIRIGPSGCAAGLVKYSGCGVLTSYEISFGGVGEPITVTGTIMARSGSLTKGTF